MQFMLLLFRNAKIVINQQTSISTFPQDLRLPSVTTIAIPNGYDWREMLAYIMKHHQMEMTGGLGPSMGMVGCFSLTCVLYLRRCF